MKRIVKGTVFAGLLVAVVGAVVSILATGDAEAARPKPGSGCPRTGIACMDVYDPVICSNGVTYGNACYAYVACATGCTSTGGGPVEVE